ncbi:MAG: PIN domain-containing protein [Clostridiales bacterium]|nr:PIN domain-containing protein [Clostridiales bacterium]
MKVLVDTNILIDAFTNRQPFAEDAAKLMRIISDGKAEGYISVHSLTDLYYILRKQLSDKKRREIISLLLQIFKIAEADNDIMGKAVSCEVTTDLEDCIQYVCAESIFADYIISRDKAGFSSGNIRCLDAGEFAVLFRGG